MVLQAFSPPREAPALFHEERETTRAEIDSGAAALGLELGGGAV
jgi:hypothetical protein